MGSTLSIVVIGACSAILSLIFFGIGVDCLVVAYRLTRHPRDFLSLSSIYGLVIAFSLLFCIASVCLAIAGSRQLRMYFLPWIIITPLWTVVVIICLVVAPMNLPHAVTLSGSSARISGTVIISVLNSAALLYVSYMFKKLYKAKSKKSEHEVNYKPQLEQNVIMNPSNTSAEVQHGQPTGISFISGHSVQLEVKRKEKSKRLAAVAAAKERDHRLDDSHYVPEDMDLSLTTAQQLQHSMRYDGVDNPGFIEDEGKY